MGKTILVTGVAGFIGFHTTMKLLDRGDTVIGVDIMNKYYDVTLKEARLAKLQKHSRANNFFFSKVDIADYAAMEKIFTEHKITNVCHLAAQAGVRYSLESPFTYENSNVKGTLTIFELCRHHDVKNVAFAISSSVLGLNEELPFTEDQKTETQISLYAATKKSTEVMAHAYHYLFGINMTALRFFTVYGPWGRPDMALFIFTKNMLAGKPIQLFNNGKHQRDFTYIADIVQGVLGAIDNPFPYKILNLARGESIPLMQYVEEIEKNLGVTAEKELLPKQQGDVETTSADITQAKKHIGYNPTTSVPDGIKEFIAWYKEYYGV
jgi:UDP-glucuronate 4-epimerase